MPTSRRDAADRDRGIRDRLLFSAKAGADASSLKSLVRQVTRIYGTVVLGTRTMNLPL
jgi:hypothetical protein